MPLTTRWSVPRTVCPRRLRGSEAVVETGDRPGSDTSAGKPVQSSASDRSGEGSQETTQRSANLKEQDTADNGPQHPFPEAFVLHALLLTARLWARLRG